MCSLTIECGRAWGVRSCTCVECVLLPLECVLLLLNVAGHGAFVHARVLGRALPHHRCPGMCVCMYVHVYVNIYILTYDVCIYTYTYGRALPHHRCPGICVCMYT